MKLSIYMIGSILLIIIMVNFVLMGVDYVLIGHGLNPLSCVPAVVLCGMLLHYTLDKVKEALDA